MILRSMQIIQTLEAVLSAQTHLSSEILGFLTRLLMAVHINCVKKDLSYSQSQIS